jgi:hypothetical protein
MHHAVKKASHFTKRFGWHLQFEAVGALFDMRFFQFTIGNINIGGQWLTVAFTATIIVIFISLSPDVTLASCLIL